jgi:hypothetical protein
VSDSGREGSKIGEVGVNMDRVEITRDLGVRFVGERSVEGS